MPLSHTSLSYTVLSKEIGVVLQTPIGTVSYLFHVDKRRRADSNRRIGVLQTPAFTSWPRRHLNPRSWEVLFYGAEEGVRTLDLLLGKETFYR